MNTIRELNKHSRRLKALLFALRYPRFLKRCVKQNISLLYELGNYRKFSLPTISPEEILSSDQSIELCNCTTRDGNVSYLELFIISTLVAGRKNILEIGTFDGNTTLQIALNSPKDAHVHTIDLPDGGMETEASLLEEDRAYVCDEQKKERKYHNTAVAKKVIQHFGDSTSYDFTRFLERGPLNFCFIDGGHSYDCVKSDTENVLPNLAADGIILWHDYNPNCPGVYRYLNELSEKLDLQHVTNTNLVVYSKRLLDTSS